MKNSTIFKAVASISAALLLTSIINPVSLAVSEIGAGTLSEIIIVEKTADGNDYAREDFSQNANPNIFNDRWTRGMYNALYQTYIDRDIIIPQNNESRLNPYYSYANAVSKDYESRRTFESVMSDISRTYSIHTDVEPYTKDYCKYPDYFIVTIAPCVVNADTATLDTIEKAKSLTDSEKLKLFTDFVRSRITYDAKSAAGIEKVFSSSAPVKGACGTFANAFQYLCEQAGIPAISVTGDNHAWVMVYTDGKWLHCDPTNNKVLVDSVKYNIKDPARAEFAKEILVPCSTK